MSDEQSLPPPSQRFVIFEGVDGVGKSTLARAFAEFQRIQNPSVPVQLASFPGNVPGTLGEWVYRFHHNRLPDAPSLRSVAPPALQLLHVAAHVDAIINQFRPHFAAGGILILDRYWWSTYAYVRHHATAKQAWALINAERAFWEQLPAPTVIYITRSVSLKPDEINPQLHDTVHRHYLEVLGSERNAGAHVLLLENNGSIDEAWRQLLMLLGLPFRPMS